jgi:hypothetical protein
MKFLRLVSLTVEFATLCSIGACGSDDNNNASSGGVSSSGGVTSSGGVSSGGASATGGASTGGTPVTPAECVAKHYSGPGITQGCKECMCDCNAATASICDANCWSLPRCIQQSCNGNATDLMCITASCAAFLAGATAAGPLTSCFTQCGPSQCSAWFLGGNPGSGGAGGMDTGGTPAGGAGGSAGMNPKGAGNGGEGG